MLDAIDFTRNYVRPAKATYHGTQIDTTNLAETTVILDTGQLAAGEYEVIACSSYKALGTSVCERVQLAHRDAANASNNRVANLFEGMTGSAAADNPNCSGFIWWPRITVATNERVRLIKTNGADVGTPAQSHNLFVRLV